MLAFNDHPARRWEPERLGLLLFSIAARITSHAWRTYYGFPTRTLGAPARRSPGPTSGPALTNLTSYQTDPTREERTPGPRNRRHPTSRTHIHAPTPATRSLPPNPKPIKPARLPRETSRPSGTQRFCGRSPRSPRSRTQRSSLPISTPVTRIALGPWVSCFHFAEEGLEDLAEAFRLLDRGHVRAVLEDDPLGAADAVGDRADHGGGREVVAT